MDSRTTLLPATLPVPRLELGSSFHEKGSDGRDPSPRFQCALAVPQPSQLNSPFFPKVGCELKLPFLFKRGTRVSMSLLPFHKYLGYSVLSLSPSLFRDLCSPGLECLSEGATGHFKPLDFRNPCGTTLTGSSNLREVWGRERCGGGVS